MLQESGIPFSTCEADIDEYSIHDGTGLENRPTSDPRELVLAIARAKADALIRSRTHGQQRGCFLITGDMVVRHKGLIREKPRDATQCAQWLRQYSGNTVKAFVGLVVTNTLTGQRFEDVVEVHQSFAAFNDNVIQRLIEESKVSSCCGALIVTSPIIKPYLLGSRPLNTPEDYFVGLPLQKLLALLQSANRQHRPYLIHRSTALSDTFLSIMAAFVARRLFVAGTYTGAVGYGLVALAAAAGVIRFGVTGGPGRVYNIHKTLATLGLPGMLLIFSQIYLSRANLVKQTFQVSATSHILTFWPRLLVALFGIVLAKKLLGNSAAEQFSYYNGMKRVDWFHYVLGLSLSVLPH